MSLAYPGPSYNLSHVIGHDAFLEALDDPTLHMHILNLEALDKSKKAETIAKEDQIEQVE